MYNFLILKLIAVCLEYNFYGEDEKYLIEFHIKESIALSVSKLRDTTLMPK